jgi:hypothetical protein
MDSLCQTSTQRSTPASLSRLHSAPHVPYQAFTDSLKNFCSGFLESSCLCEYLCDGMLRH